MKKVLITCTDLMMKQFLFQYVKYLDEKGDCVDIACSAVGDKMKGFRDKKELNKLFSIHLKRSPFSVTNIVGLKELYKIINSNYYDYIWTNEPVVGLMTRLAANPSRKKGTIVIYMAHGFHFYKGAPLKNWIFYYVIERFMVRYTDILVTLNREDYRLAKTKFKDCTARYIHGIGYEERRTEAVPHSILKRLKEELGIQEGEAVILSVGELSRRKNHKVVIDALSQVEEKFIYIICGAGPLEKELKSLAKKRGINKKVIFAGYREDIGAICQISDLFVFPSIQEGLPVALMEAMGNGLSVVASSIRGVTDLIDEGKGGYLIHGNCSAQYAEKIDVLIKNKKEREKKGQYNREKIKNYSFESVKKEIYSLFSERGEDFFR